VFPPLTVLPKGHTVGLSWDISAKSARGAGEGWLAFTLAPHLQLINYRRRFSPFPGI
jgi:hypothetical protein